MTVTRRGRSAVRLDRHRTPVLLSNPGAYGEGRMNSDRPIGVAGAGSIGCFVGGMLAAGGRRVALLARPRVIGEIEANGLRLTGFDGFEHRLPANKITILKKSPP